MRGTRPSRENRTAAAKLKATAYSPKNQRPFDSGVQQQQGYVASKNGPSLVSPQSFGTKPGPPQTYVAGQFPGHFVADGLICLSA